MKKVRFSRKRKAVTGVPKCSVLSTQYVYVGTDRISTCQIERPAALRFLHCFSFAMVRITLLIKLFAPLPIRR